MNILAIVQSASLSIDLERPSTLFASTDRTMLEVGDVVNTAAKQILDDYDWQTLLKTATVTGDGIETGFTLPADFSRMVQDASLVGVNWRFYPAQQMQDFNHWLELLTYPVETWQQHWMVFGGKLNIMPILPLGDVLNYGYISNAIVVGADSSQFTADTDEYVLDDELLRLSIIWNWKASKGFDFQTDLAKYAERLEKLRFRDVGSRQTIVTGRGARSWARFGGFA